LDNVAKNTQTAFDTASLKAHLAKMDAEDFWDKKGKKITEDFNTSKESVGKLAVEAMGEISSFFNKLSSTFSDKK